MKLKAAPENTSVKLFSLVLALSVLFWLLDGVVKEGLPLSVALSLSALQLACPLKFI
jgi:uncharacterized membrane-anchored protein